MSINRESNRSYTRKHGFRPSNIIAISFEAGNSPKSRERKYFDMLIKNNTNSRIKIVPLFNEENKSAVNHVFTNLHDYVKKEKLKLTVADSDQAWMVIDVDHQKDIISTKLNDIRDNNYRLAISNPCFEIWLYLHKGDIEIKADHVVFKHFHKGQEIITTERLEDDKSSKKVKEIYGKAFNGVTSFEDEFLDQIERTIIKSESLNNGILDEGLLSYGKGKTQVHELVREIVNK